MIISWITRVVIPQTVHSTLYTDNAIDVWKDLRERFSKWDLFRISDILQEVHHLKQGERIVSDYFINLKIYGKNFNHSDWFPNMFVK